MKVSAVQVLEHETRALEDVKLHAFDVDLDDRHWREPKVIQSHALDRIALRSLN
jgi:hypothetical protein